MPTHTVTRYFGDGIGLNNTSQHHTAFDIHVSNNDTTVTLFASIDRKIATYRDAEKYRDYLTISKNIEDIIGTIIGKMVTLYGYTDLNLDSLDGCIRNNQFVQQVDIISKHLYSGTLGGTHLHFEIQYYRPIDVGNEDYYG
jgi:hypothetical protein